MVSKQERKRRAEQSRAALLSSFQSKNAVKTVPASTPTILPQEAIQTPSPTTSTSIGEKFERDVVRKQILGFLAAVIVIVGLVTTAFQLAGVITMEIAHSLIFFAAVVAITYICIFVFTSSFFEFKSTKCKVVVVFLSLFATIYIFSLVDSWMVNKRAEIDRNAEQQKNPMQTQAIPSPTVVAKLKEPTFTEGIDQVSVSIGRNVMMMTIAQLEKDKLPFSVANIPAVIYSENNKPYVDLDIYTPPPNLPVKLRHNILLNRPAEWDMNSDEKGLEIINEKKEPVFQLYYKSPSQIFINGLFMTKLGFVIATETGIQADREIQEPYPIKPLFKYPSAQHNGERR